MKTQTFQLPCVVEGFQGRPENLTADDIDWGTEEDVVLAVENVVCPDCGGEGKILNPSIGQHAYTREDMDEDPSFAEEYLKGAHGIYGVTCPCCGGRNVITVPTSKGSDPMDFRRYTIVMWEIQDRDDARTYRMECGIYE